QDSYSQLVRTYTAPTKYYTHHRRVSGSASRWTRLRSSVRRRSATRGGYSRGPTRTGRMPSDEQKGATSPRVWVRQSVPGDLEGAVREGGGIVVPLEEANAVIWAADEPEALGRRLHPGIQWVQLLSAGIEDWFK